MAERDLPMGLSSSADIAAGEGGYTATRLDFVTDMIRKHGINWCRKHSSLGGHTPAIAHGLATEVWSVRKDD